MRVESRLAKLEQAEAISAEDVPRFVSVATREELADLGLTRPVKVYIGISPDDWNEDNVSTEA